MSRWLYYLPIQAAIIAIATTATIMGTLAAIAITAGIIMATINCLFCVARFKAKYARLTHDCISLMSTNNQFYITKNKTMTTTMKPLLMILIFIAGILTAANAQTNADAVLGKWTNDEKNRVIEFVKTGDKYNAVIKEAPDNSIVGKNQLTDLVHKNGSYSGKVYLPKKGKSYPCTVSIKSDGSLELTAKAGFMSKSQTWTRVQ